MPTNSFRAAAKLRVGNADYDYFRLATLQEQGVADISRLPFSIRILLENLLRNEDGKRVSADDVTGVAMPTLPARVFDGASISTDRAVPCVH